MIKKELLKRNKDELKKIYNFWGFFNIDDPDELIKRIEDEEHLLLAIGRLKDLELILLNRLIQDNGKVIKGEIEGLFNNKDDLDSAIDGLLEKCFVYVRKNRINLTDKLDIIYIFSNIKNNIFNMKKLSVNDIVNYFAKILSKEYLLEESVPDDLKELILRGGFAPISNSFDRYNRMYKRGLLAPVFICNEEKILPAWIIRDNYIQYREIDIDKVEFLQSIFLNNVMHILDCLLYSSLKKNSINSCINRCLRNVKGLGGIRKKYRNMLYKLEIIREEDGKLTIDKNFINGDYDFKIFFLKERLADNEDGIIDYLEKIKKCSKVYLISKLVREKVLKRLFDNSSFEIDTQGILNDYLEKINNLVLLGFLIEDKNSDYISFNNLGKEVDKNRSVLVNSNKEIVIYSKDISFYASFVIEGFSQLLYYGNLTRLKMDRNSIIKGIRYIGDIDVFIEVLGRSSIDAVSKNIITSIEEWSSGFLNLYMEKRFIVRKDSKAKRLRIYDNPYIRSCIEEESQNYIILKDIDVSRLKREARKNNIFIE